MPAVIAFALFAYTGFYCQLNIYYFLGVAISGVALFYQHLIVNPRDLSKISMSFFTMNGTISIALFVATWLSILTS